MAPDNPKTAGGSKLETIIAKASVQKPDEYPKWASSSTGGVIPMSITGRFDKERERLGDEFFEKWRQWRITWIKDQALHASEPRDVPQLKAECTNIFRKIYKMPLDYVESQLLKPKLGAEGAFIARSLIGRVIIGYVGALMLWYHLRYEPKSWETSHGILVAAKRSPVYPGDPAYPLVGYRAKKQDYYDMFFSKREVFK